MYRLLLEHSGEKKIGTKNPDISLNYKEETLERKVATAIVDAAGNLRLNGGQAEVPERAQRCVDSSIRSKTKTAESYRESYGGSAITATDEGMSWSLARTHRQAAGVCAKTLTGVVSHAGDNLLYVAAPIYAVHTRSSLRRGALNLIWSGAVHSQAKRKIPS
jgi:hypothetical protein